MNLVALVALLALTGAPPGPHDVLDVRSTRPLEHLGFYAGLTGDYVRDDPFTTELALGFGLFDRIDLRAALPLHDLDLGDLHLEARSRLFTAGPLGVALAAEVLLADPVVVPPRLALDLAFDPILVALDLGYAVRPDVDDAAVLGLGLQADLGANFAFLVTFTAELDLPTVTDTTLDALAGIRWRSTTGVVLTAATSLARPRALLTLAWTTDAPSPHESPPLRYATLPAPAPPLPTWPDAIDPARFDAIPHVPTPPPPEPTIATTAPARGEDVFALPDRIYFRTGSDELKRRSRAVLEAAAAALVANPHIVRLRIEGHTDARGDKEMNVDLSERRARRVMDFLIQAGVAPERLSARGYGPTRPAVPSKRAHRANRRVTFRILEVAK